MYQEKNNVKYICKCGCSQTSHENNTMKDNCICNPPLLTSNVTSLDYILPMINNHISSPIQPFCVINVDMLKKNSISSLVDRMWSITHK